MILIGTDSKVYQQVTKYCTCILDTETGLLQKHYVASKTLPRAARLHQEAALTLSYSARYPNAELHFDYSTNPKHKSYPLYLAYKHAGKFKPEAFMATSVADYFLTH
jgi:predicted RNase H-related nuclease YkuK (DUF458 family)